MPTVTAASTAETCSCSAGTYAAYALSSPIVFSISGSLSRRRISAITHADGEADRDPARGLPQELPARVQQREATALVAAATAIR